MSTGVFKSMNRAEVHRAVKSQATLCTVFSILEESRYRLDPESERQMRACLRKLESITANSHLIDRDEVRPDAGQCSQTNVLRLVPRDERRAAA